MHQDQFSKAIKYMIVSSLGFAMMQLMLVSAGDIPVSQKVFFRNIVGFFLSLYFLRRHLGQVLPKRENLKPLLLRSGFGTLGMLFYVYSLVGLSMADGAMLNKMSPFFVIIFAAIILKERLTRVKILALVGAFLSALLIIKPEFSMQTTYGMSGFLGSMFAGLAYVFVRVLKGRETPLMVVMFFSFFSSAILFIPMVVGFKSLSAKLWLILLAAGFFAFIGQYYMTKAYGLAPAGEISIYSYFMVAFSVVLGFIVFQQIPDMWSLLGIGGVVLAAYYLYRKEMCALGKARYCSNKEP